MAETLFYQFCHNNPEMFLPIFSKRCESQNEPFSLSVFFLRMYELKKPKHCLTYLVTNIQKQPQKLHFSSTVFHTSRLLKKPFFHLFCHGCPDRYVRKPIHNRPAVLTFSPWVTDTKYPCPTLALNLHGPVVYCPLSHLHHRWFIF